jgi:hypothetical protein
MKMHVNFDQTVFTGYFLPFHLPAISCASGAGRRVAMPQGEAGGDERQKFQSLSEGKAYPQTWRKIILLIPQMSNASNEAIVFPPFGGIAFHHFHQESDENKKIQ